ncbi:SMP-30/gluconolactonase/LRE family protein [Streptomyces sp. NPDC057910]|uniref:SMP-30/gluconolactonase/LRE family protein n=1 Tax=Streptomyces sp. NPDC057910 TaxID=3346278 RepID=UPI0036EAB847
MFRLSRLAVIATATAVGAAALTALGPGPASAAFTPPLSDPEIVQHYSFTPTLTQTPENIVLEPDCDNYSLYPECTADMTLSLSRQVIRQQGGSFTVLAQLPDVPNASTPILGKAAVMGIARASDGTLYVNFATGESKTGVWRINPADGTFKQIAQLPNPANALPNGLALDETRHVLYVADTVGAKIWSVPQSCNDACTPTVWASPGSKADPKSKLLPRDGASLPAGPNGLRVHNGAVWVTNTTQGTLLRFPVLPNGKADTVAQKASELPWIDDFAFTGSGDQVLAALAAGNSTLQPPNGDTGSVVLVNPNDGHKTVLTSQDGLNTPTSVAVGPKGMDGGRTVYVTSGSYFSSKPAPNLVQAHLN